MSEGFDIVVVGGGNAGLSAALSAREYGKRVLVVEKAPKREEGGNSFFTAGAFRFPYQSIEDIQALIPNLSPAECARIEVGRYSEEDFYNDLLRVTDYLTDLELADTLVGEAYNAILWLSSKGVRFELNGRQAFENEGKLRFWGGVIAETVGGGAGLIEAETRACSQAGIPIWYDTAAHSLVMENGQVTGLCVKQNGKLLDIRCEAVILAAGGFEANAEWRAKYLGPDWDLAKVRGTRHNLGDGIRMAQGAGANLVGHWSGCHSVAWDYNAPTVGDRRIGDSFQKHSYPFGVMVNKRGERFADEGADFRNYTYAKYGKDILKQPDRVAFQIFDKKVDYLLRDEYRIREVTKASADTLGELAIQLGIDKERFEETIMVYNAAVQDQTFNPTIKDGKGTSGIYPRKSNWANTIDTPPFTGYAVTCGITFTFGGVHVNGNAQVLDTIGQPIPGLYAAGEMVGGLFYHNYPGGSGLTSGTVFGKIAGQNAAER